MKEEYFTVDSIRSKAGSMLETMQNFRVRHPLNLDPVRSALLILDMQKYFLEPDSHAFVPSAPAIIPGIKILMDHFRKRDLPVIFSRHLDHPYPGNPMLKWWKGRITADNSLSEIIPELEPSSDPVIEKHQYDAFFETGLTEHLRSLDITQLVVAGLMTHLCFESTARSAFIRGYDVIALIDGTATYNESMHRGSLTSLAHGFAVPALCSEIKLELENPRNE